MIQAFGDYTIKDIICLFS